LRATRVRYGIRVDDIADRLGLSGERVRQFERSAQPKTSDVERYLRAVQTLAGSAL